MIGHFGYQNNERGSKGSENRRNYLPAYNLSGNLIIRNNKSMKESKIPHWTYIKFSSPTTEYGQSVKLSVFLYYIPSHY